MKERPILFSAEMVQAIQKGRKTQTRRIVKRQPIWTEKHGFVSYGRSYGLGGSEDPKGLRNLNSECPYGKPGSRLGMIKETWVTRFLRKLLPIFWSVIWRFFVIDWIEILAVRVERLQDICVNDAIAEGFPGVTMNGFSVQWSPRGWFFSLWDSINGFGAYEKNPWVWVVEFRKAKDAT